MRAIPILVLLLLQQSPLAVTVIHDGAPVAGAVITCATMKVETDAQGRASLAVPAGGCTLVVTREGLTPHSAPVTPSSPPLIVTLEEEIEVEEEVIVTATRTGRLASDQATRVEVVTREEIEEKLLMTPGDIVMLLNETGGLRLQPTAPALGAASIRVQGMPGRFTAVLTDGLPINGTQVASLGLLQIPPMDLQQVEVIKGAASALYGPSAVGGVINLVTRRPTPEHVGEAIVNITSRSGADGLLWLSGPINPKQGYTLLAGVHGQNASDVDDDGWADLPRYRRVIARPKITFAPEHGGSIDISGGFTRESRLGGGLTAALPTQSVDTTRGDLGLVWRKPAANGVFVVKGAGSIVNQTFDAAGGGHDNHSAFGLAEVSMSRGFGRHILVAGAALEVQRHENAFSFSRVNFDYRWITPGVFVQDDITVSSMASLSVSARVDGHSVYGALWSPRASFRLRPRGWDLRVSAGRGAFAPTVFLDEVEEVGAGYVGSFSLKRAEMAETWSMDLSRNLGVVELAGTWFGSRIRNAVLVEEVTTFRTFLSVKNRPEGSEFATRTSGVELFGRFRRAPWIVTTTYTWVNATQTVNATDTSRETVPLTPKGSFGLIAAWERHGKSRVGLEVYRTGRQRLEDDPFRLESEPYTIIGLLAERRFGRVRAFVNLENLTDVRQSDYSPLRRPSPTGLGRLVVSSWAPLEGRTVNAGVRFAF